MVSSYAFFIVLIALVLAFMQKTTLQASKDSVAAVYAKELHEQIDNDLYKVFNGLADYRPFYQNMLDELDNFSTVNASNETNDKSPATDSFLRMVEKSLALITPPPCELPDDGMLPLRFRKPTQLLMIV